ncbi:MAG: bifunctional ornithine acetyltransferase/N-acetylglutamate synthase, partial [Verrucomicrobiae bacterium]|nr:bifunctional ornithine acetyltransferase/N-acetylglutamate synthase [Verrucomicrobiae bacterium]
MTTEFEKIAGGVCAPLGFRAAGITCGIKKPDSPKRDLALIVSDFPAVTAGVFTENEVKAAPVRLSASYLKQAEPRAIVANSGNANACTGAIGMEHARRMAESAAKALGIKRREVLVCSTGIIGLPMPIERIEPRLPELVSVLGRDDAANATAAEAIMTSDTKPKSYSIKFMLGGKEIRIGAIAKGAGMINPNMATMLCFVTTDARITKGELQAATKDAVDHSFNRITIDGDMSTNDTVLVMANQ